MIIDKEKEEGNSWEELIAKDQMIVVVCQIKLV